MMFSYNCGPCRISPEGPPRSALVSLPRRLLPIGLRLLATGAGAGEGRALQVVREHGPGRAGG